MGGGRIIKYTFMQLANQSERTMKTYKQKLREGVR